MMLRFSVPLPPKELRVNTHTMSVVGRDGVRRRKAIHWSTKAKARREYQEAIWCAAWNQPASNKALTYLPAQPWPEAEVTYHWYSIHETDEDNIIANMKAALDVLKATGPRPLGVIADDGPGISVRAVWLKAMGRGDERVEIEVVKR